MSLQTFVPSLEHQIRYAEEISNFSSSYKFGKTGGNDVIFG